MIGKELTLEADPVEKQAGGPGVLAGHEVGRSQDRSSPVGQVRQVPDRGCHHIEVARLSLKGVLAQWVLLPWVGAMPGTWFSQEAGCPHGIEESPFVPDEQPAMTEPRARRRSAGDCFDRISCVSKQRTEGAGSKPRLHQGGAKPGTWIQTTGSPRSSGRSHWPPGAPISCRQSRDFHRSGVQAPPP